MFMEVPALVRTPPVNGAVGDGSEAVIECPAPSTVMPSATVRLTGVLQFWLRVYVVPTRVPLHAEIVPGGCAEATET
ncbi:MAG: hypothetical protein ACRD1G_15705, partial [Acidimicrobiales bacterium]